MCDANASSTQIYVEKCEAGAKNERCTATFHFFFIPASLTLHMTGGPGIWIDPEILESGIRRRKFSIVFIFDRCNKDKDYYRVVSVGQLGFYCFRTAGAVTVCKAPASLYNIHIYEVSTNVQDKSKKIKNKK